MMKTDFMASVNMVADEHKTIKINTTARHVLTHCGCLNKTNSKMVVNTVTDDNKIYYRESVNVVADQIKAISTASVSTMADGNKTISVASVKTRKLMITKRTLW